jgi:pimeloyl-ACP methyl ester carboxylesterase
VLGIMLLVGFIGVNAIAYELAWSMTHYVDGGVKTKAPEGLSLARKVYIVFTGVRVPRPTNDESPVDVSLEYETIRFGGPSGKDCEAWYVPRRGAWRATGGTPPSAKPEAQHTGGAKAICLEFPPYTCSKSGLMLATQAFHDMGYDVLMVDYHGVGGSVGDRTTLGYEEAGDVAAASAYAHGRWPGEKQVFYGPSMGGAAIIRAVGDLGVQPSAVIVESTFDRLLSTAENRFHSMGLPAFPTAELLVFWGGEQMGYDGFRYNPADYATRIHCPVLVMQGSRDRRVTDAQAQNLYDRLSGPKRLEVFGDCGHCNFLANHPERWKQSVSEFLDSSVH